MKKFNGHRCERRNLTDLLLGTGPDGRRRAKPKAKKRPKNFTTEPAVNKKYLGGPYMDYSGQLDQEYGAYQRQQFNPFAPQSSIQFPGAAPGTTSSATPGLLERLVGPQVDMTDLAPGEVPEAMEQFNMRQAKIAAASAGLNALGTAIGNTDRANEENLGGDLLTGASGALSGAGAALPYASMIPGVAPFALVGGALYSVYKKKAAEQKAQRDKLKRAKENNKLRLENTLEYSRQIKNMYDDQGQMVDSYMARMGGPMGQPDYETEKNEVILASPNDPPVAMGQGGYNRISKNLYRANGPSHEMGGVPTKGATEPFVDAQGQEHDSPYVFSDAPEMRFDASDILSMIR